MSERRGPWRLLGIDAKDSDERAVKRAYAQKLKAIDVDADPAGFIALRKAMEQALDELRWRDHPEADDWDDDWYEEEDDTPFIASRLTTPAELTTESAAEPDDAVAEPPPATDKNPDPLAALNDELKLLWGLLFDEQDSDGARWQIELCWRQIMDNPALGRIDILADVEQWFAGAIAQSLPRSDPLVWPAIKFFNWSGDERRWNGDGRVAAILRRQRDLYFLHQLVQPDNLLHYAYNLLHQSPAEVTPAELKRADNGMRILLRSIRYQFPTAEWNFDETKVRAWIDHLEAPPTGRLARFASGGGQPVFDDGLVFDGKNVSGSGFAGPVDTSSESLSTPPIVWLGLVLMPYVACWWTLRKGYSLWARLAAFGWAAVALFLVIAADRPATLDQKVGDRMAALERANPDLVAIRTGKPALYAEIRAAAHEREKGNIAEDAMRKRIDGIIENAYTKALPMAAQDLLVQHFRLRQMRLSHLLRSDPAACMDDNRPVAPASLPASYQQQLRQLIVQAITRAAPATVDDRKIDMIPKMREAAGSLGITLDQYAQRLSDKTNVRSGCEAKLALLQAIGREGDADIAAFVRSSLISAAAKSGS